MEELRHDSIKNELGMSIFCWNKFWKKSQSAQYSPFFVSLAIGDLSHNDFRTFIPQNLRFLKAFVEAYELAMNRANNDAERSALRGLSISVCENIKTFVNLLGTMKASGSRRPEQTKCALADNYRNFLLENASSDSRKTVEPKGRGVREVVPVYTLASVAPFMRLFYHLCHQIQNKTDPSYATNDYNSWIDYYCFDAFKDLLKNTEAELDKFSAPFNGDENVETGIEETYQKSLDLLVYFVAEIPTEKKTYFPLSQLQDPIKHQLILFCDYNLTCTSEGSAIVLVQAQISMSPDTEDWKGVWAELSNRRAEELRKFWNKYAVFGVMGKKDNARGLGSAHLSKALEEAAMLEERANGRMEESGLLRNLSREVIKDSAMNIKLWDDCKSFLDRIVKNGGSNVDLHIISCCCCGDLIRSVLSDLSLDKINSNELLYNEESVTTGDIETKLLSASDKLACFCKIKEELTKDDWTKEEIKCMTVYIGGDMVDLLCLLEADIGILLLNSSTARRLMGVARHFGVEFLPLFPFLVKEHKDRTEADYHSWKSDTKILYTVSCWAEIEAFIMGL